MSPGLFIATLAHPDILQDREWAGRLLTSFIDRLEHQAMDEGANIMNALIARLTACLLLLAGSCAHAGTVWESFQPFGAPGLAGIEAGDFDCDGRAEAVVSGIAPHYPPYREVQLLAVLSADAAGVMSVSDMSTLPIQISGTLIVAPADGCADRLAAVVGDGLESQVLILGDVPLRILRVIDAPPLSGIRQIADIDGDGELEILAFSGAPMSSGYPVVLDFATGSVEWVGSTTTSDATAVQLDQDPAMELILGGMPGRIVDGSSHLVEWSYPSGFDGHILGGHFDADPDIAGFVVVGGQSAQVFRSSPYSPVSEFGNGGGSAPRVTRVNGATYDQVAMGQYGAINIYDPRSGQLVRSVPDNLGARSFAIGDIDADGHDEVIYGTGYGSGTVALRAVDSVTMTEDFLQGEGAGPYSALAVADFAGDGTRQVAFLTEGLRTDLRILDAETGVFVQSRDYVLSTWTESGPFIAAAQLDGDVQAEIIVAGSVYNDGEVAAFDGHGLTEQWRAFGSAAALDSAPIAALAIIDVNADGKPDPVLATEAGRIVVLDGATGVLLWQSVDIAGSSLPRLGTFLVPGQGPRIAMSRGTGLYVFNPITHLLESSTGLAMAALGLRQWGEGDSCRLGVIDASALVSIFRCGGLVPDGQRQLPAGTEYFSPTAADGTLFLVAANARLHEVDAAGNVETWTPPLGESLGAGNQGVVQLDPDGVHFDVFIGSDYLVTRQRMGPDLIFASGFD